MTPRDVLGPEWWRFVEKARVAVLTTLDPGGQPASVPICFVALDAVLYSPLDDKPKRNTDPCRLRRVRNLLSDPRAAVLIHRWDEDWAALAFVNLGVIGSLLEPGSPSHAAAVAALRRKYPQYERHALEKRPVLRLEPTTVSARWAASEHALDQSP